MRIEDIVKRCHLALRKIEEALHQYKRGDIETANEGLLFALDETINAEQHMDNYIKKLQEYRKNLEKIEKSIIEAIEARGLDEKKLKEIEKNYQNLLKNLVEKLLITVETHNDSYKYN
jgi:predicted DNA-binding protein YlxM (UPF0122 family)